MRLDQFSQNFLKSFSREAIKRKIQKGEIKILKRPHPHKPSSKVYHQEIVEITTYNQEENITECPQIIYQDKNILITTKPPFMTTHPTGRHLFNCLTVFYEEKLGHKMHSIHRLDRETSGIQIMGKTPHGAKLITPFFENSIVKKTYFFIAKTYNSPFPQKENFMARENLGQKKDFIPRLFTHSFPENSHNGKKAHTHFIIFYKEKNYALGLAFPQTGRQHQIRSHAAHHGYPLLGDKLYNGDPHIFTRHQDGEETINDQNIMEINRQALHALAIKLPYPQPKSLQMYHAPIPDDLKNWITNNLNISIQQIESRIKTELTNWH